MSLSRRVGRNTLWQICGRLVTSLIAFEIVTKILPSVMDKADVGVFAFHLAFYQLLVNVLDFGAGTIVIREAARDRQRAGRLLGLLVRLKARFAIGAAVFLIGLAFVAEGATARTALLCVAALHVFSHLPAAAGAIFQVDMAFARQAQVAVAGQVAWLAATAALALAGVHEPAAYLLAFGLGFAVNGALAWRWSRERVRLDFSATRAELAALWSQVWPAGVSITAASVYFYIDSALLRPLAGEEAVAIYSQPYRLMTFVLMVPVLFSQVILPVYSRLWAEGREALRPFFVRTTRFLFALGAPVSACVWLVSRDVMALLFRPEYAAGAPALSLLSLAVVCVFCAYPHVLLLLASGHQRTMMRISVAGAVLNVLANLWAIPHWGISGAASVTVATEAFVLAASALCAARLTQLHVPLAALLRPALCAAGAAGALYLLLPHLPDAPLPRVAAGLLAGAGAALLAGVLPPDFGTERGAPVDVLPEPIA
jgi:O-antigen/teichoic acid export membrane protein